MYDTEVPPDIDISQVGPLELFILLLGKVCHGSLQLSNYNSRG